MPGQFDYHQPDTDFFITRGLTSELLLQQPLWPILPFQPTFYHRIHACTDGQADSLCTLGKYVGAQKET